LKDQGQENLMPVAGAGVSSLPEDKVPPEKKRTQKK